MSEIEHFMPILMDREEEGNLSPILAHGGVRFMWIKHNNLYRILTATHSSFHKMCLQLLPQYCFAFPKLVKGRVMVGLNA